MIDQEIEIVQFDPPVAILQEGVGILKDPEGGVVANVVALILVD